MSEENKELTKETYLKRRIAFGLICMLVSTYSLKQTIPGLSVFISRPLYVFMYIITLVFMLFCSCFTIDSFLTLAFPGYPELIDKLLKRKDIK